MTKSRIHYLLKVGRREHIEDLRNHGIVYMNSINFFRELEEDEQRSDIQEGIERIEQITWIKLIKDGKEFEFKKESSKNIITSAQLRVANPELEGNIFSMIAITNRLAEETDKLDNRNSKFGDSFLVIFNPKEFLRRFENAIKKSGMSFQYGVVWYYDEENYNGGLGVFCKPMKFKHQNEFRVFVGNSSRNPLIVNIGSIEDISDIFSIEELSKIRFGQENNKD